MTKKKKNTKIAIIVSISLSVAIFLILMIVKASKDLKKAKFWTDQLKKLAGYVNESDDGFVSEYPESLSSAVEWAEEYYPQRDDTAETLSEWIQRQITFSIKNRNWLVKLID